MEDSVLQLPMTPWATDRTTLIGAKMGMMIGYGRNERFIS